jgi:phosphatidylglycerol lysyltransferase
MLDRASEFDCFQPAETLRHELVSKWGGFTLAWSLAVQDGLEYFGDETGFVAFGRKWGYVYALGDPVCSPSRSEELLHQFLNRFPNAGFVQTSAVTARCLEAKGFYVNELGIDTRIDLQSYDFAGKQKEHLRYASNWLTRRGYRIVEEADCDEVRLVTAEISEQWRRNRIIKSREVAFLNRPMQDNEWDLTAANSSINGVRRFFLLDKVGRRVAFVFFDPVFENGTVIGYATSFKRRLDKAPPVAEVGITRCAIDVFRGEGLNVLFLGLSPLAETENLEFRKNWFLDKSFRYLFNARWFNRWVYNLKGHAEFKQRFRGCSEKVYFASPKISNDLRLLGLLRLCRAI